MTTPIHREPCEWWYFKRLSRVTVQDQARKAEEYQIDQKYWLGAHPKARFRNSKDIRKLVFTKDDGINNRDPRTHPIRRNDTVWVQNIFCLGHDIPRIWNTLEFLHKYNVSLHIESIGYFDDCSNRQPESRMISKKYDFTLVTKLLSELSSRSKKEDLSQKAPDNEGHKGPGRPRLDIRFQTLSTRGQDIIMRYCTDPGYHRREALEDIRNKGLSKDTPGTISKKRFYDLILEYDNMLRAQKMETFRTRPKKKINVKPEQETEQEAEKEKAQD